MALLPAARRASKRCCFRWSEIPLTGRAQRRERPRCRRCGCDGRRWVRRRHRRGHRGPSDRCRIGWSSSARSRRALRQRQHRVDAGAHARGHPLVRRAAGAAAWRQGQGPAEGRDWRGRRCSGARASSSSARTAPLLEAAVAGERRLRYRWRSAARTVARRHARGCRAAAREMAEPGDVVLLSPACTSFDAYAELRRARRGVPRAWCGDMRRSGGVLMAVTAHPSRLRDGQSGLR